MYTIVISPEEFVKAHKRYITSYQDIWDDERQYSFKYRPIFNPYGFYSRDIVVWQIQNIIKEKTSIEDMDVFLVKNMKVLSLEEARKEKQIKQEKDLIEYESSEMYKLYEYYAEYECGECNYLVMDFFTYCPSCGAEFE